MAEDSFSAGVTEVERVVLEWLESRERGVAADAEELLLRHPDLADALRERFQAIELVDAALEGARLRLRPILMTSFAFILGCAPLWIAAGSGAAARQTLGTVVITGMIAATGLAIFVIPALFVLVGRFASKTVPDGPSPALVTEGQH